MNTQPVILYVEDDPESRMIMQLLLSNLMGLNKFTILPDSRNFLDNVAALPELPDIFLLDIHVPPYTGFDMMAMLREQPAYQNIPVVAVTASVMNEEVQKLKDAGFNGVIAKPLDMDLFPAVLERLLRGERIWYVLND
jgi:CheY-like chemotaxis protein